MEGPIEKQWRRDAAWAIAVIVAAGLFVIQSVVGMYGAIGKVGAEPAASSWFNAVRLGLLFPYVVLILCAGGTLFFLYVAALAGGVRIFPRREELPVTWNLWAVAKAAAVVYLSSGLLVFIVASILGGRADERYLIIGSACFLHLALLVVAVAFVAMSGGSQRAAGFTLKGWPADVAHGVLGWVATLPVFYAAFAVVVAVLAVLRLEPQPNPVIPILQEAGSTWFQWATIFLVTILGPFTEEVFFRGYLYPAMRRRLSVRSAIVINGILFALIHPNPASFLPIMVLGMAMAYLFEKTRSLVACTTFHIVHNTVEIVILYYLVA